MRYVSLGNTDMKVSVIALGLWAAGGTFWGGTDEKAIERAIDSSIDSGVNFIDTAPGYGYGLSEEILGRAIKGKRSSLIIATKCGLVWNVKEGYLHYRFPGVDGEKSVDVYRRLKKDSIKNELHQSLKLIGTDYIDLYQTHVPDPYTPVSETMEALLELKSEGYIRAIGVSNVTIDILEEYKKSGRIESDQEKYSIIDRVVETSLLPWCKKNKASMLAYSPLSQGLLTGNIDPERKFTGDDARILFSSKRFSRDGVIRTNKLLKNTLGAVAEKYNVTIGNISVAYLVQNSTVIAICGARNERQAIENAKAGSVILDRQDKESVESFINQYEEA
jgi:methylglyoxal reductase